MSIESDLVTLLGPLVGGRVARDVFPQPNGVPEWPAIRFSLIDGQNAETICGTDGVDTDDSTYQIDCVDVNGKGADALARSVVDLMDLFPLPTVRTARRADPYDPATKTFRVSLDYLIAPSSD